MIFIMMRLVTIFSVILYVQCQLKLEISSEDIIKPGDDNSSKDLSSVEDDIREMSSLESSQQDFVRRRRRKMLTSTLSPSLKLDPKEPRLRVKVIYKRNQGLLQLCRSLALYFGWTCTFSSGS